MKMALGLLILFQAATGYELYDLQQQIHDIPNQQSIAIITGYMKDAVKAQEAQISINDHQAEINKNVQSTLNSQLTINHNLGNAVNMPLPMPALKDTY